MRTPTAKSAMAAHRPQGGSLARETDFLDLYKILGLNPGCGLAEFKQAYRRRVAVLHPDRRSADQVSAIAAERLQQLTARYGAAMEFERRHGRLPGAAPTRQPPPEGSPPPIAHVAIAEPRRRIRWRLALPAVFACALWLLWDFGWFAGNTEPETAAATSQAVAATSAVEGRRATTQPFDLELGMSGEAVRAIEGEPTLMGGDRWEYGPSWIRFEDGKVTDWYSSPLRPLKTTPTQAISTPG
jgi:DnaJ domain